MPSKSPLPSSDEKKFWGEDAELHLNKKEKIKMGKTHKWIQRGNVAICQSCPFEHAVFLDDKHEVREGKIVRKLP